MSVTICVTSANDICYESSKSGFLRTKTRIFTLFANAINSQITDNEHFNKTSKYGHFFHQVSTRLKKCPYFRG